MRRLDLKTYSLDTVKKDIDLLLKEWREERIDDMDASISLELARIDAIIVELWAQWEKSKQDTEKTATKKKGAAKRNDGITGIETQAIEETRYNTLKRFGKKVARRREKTRMDRKTLQSYGRPSLFPSRKNPKVYSKSTIKQPQRAVILQNKSYFCRKQYSHASSGVTQHPRTHFLFSKTYHYQTQRISIRIQNAERKRTTHCLQATTFQSSAHKG